ncbi:2,3-dihydroxybenzoate-AMP ligase [Acrocarpospora pleiomorpha]|uniref:2,3-dihydroxybenzoate-AMP ligase n=1 Tax=Acrocarpospora pleiomorpha TaxID=90975 RepID=A0A5M3XLB0_9ACTN|nr:(2,3-dihydroxybenzoyl)adenylate synthase [Acrocarpospora pleiomorpha]GES21662.1 2,3-dihydroxybenzoate-AMP ligase [Acrocarpospora pleiomorpha]
MSFVPYPADFAERYRAAGYWRGETFGSLLRERAAAFGDRVALVGGADRWTYSELDERADRLAAGFARLSIGPGDRVVVQLPNRPAFYEVIFALFRVGALPVFALPAHRSAEIGYFCAFTEASAYVTTDVHDGFDHRELAAVLKVPYVIVDGDPGPYIPLESLRVSEPVTGVRPPRPGDVAFLQLSGGSTGTPKLIPRTHDDYLYSVRGSAEICGLDADSVYLCALPAAHNFPLSSPGVLGVLYAGGHAVMAPRPTPDTCFPLIEREGVTITALVPPLAIIWAEAATHATADLSSLRVLQVGGATFAEEAARRVGPALGCTLQQVFGMAEGLVNYTRLDDPADLVVGTQGRPISPDDEILIVDDDDRPVAPGDPGHLLTRGPYTIRGYYRAEEHNRTAFTGDGFYRTGDIVRRLATGHLVVVGRAKDQINRGGEKISAKEVENHLLAHPTVLDTSVVAVPDDYLGERTRAYVVPRDGGPAPTAPVLRRFLRERGLAAYKIPDQFAFVDTLPTTAVGKISKGDLRSR